VPICHEAIQRRMILQVNVLGRDLAGFVTGAQARMTDEGDMHPGHITDWGGQFENLREASARLAVAAPAALLLIFMLLFMTCGCRSRKSVSHSSCLQSFVMVMQATNFRELYDLSQAGRLQRSRFRAIHLQ
jgi:Cu/Ag efflux pump CusA